MSTSRYSRLENTISCHPRNTTSYILHVVLITTHTHDRRKSNGKKKQRKEKKTKESKEKKAKNDKEKETHSLFFFLFLFFSTLSLSSFSGQAVVTGVIPSPPRFLPSIFVAHRVQQSHCSSIVHRMLLTHALALSASQIVHKKKSQRIYTSMHSAGLELAKLTYTRLEDNLIRHRGDR